MNGLECKVCEEIQHKRGVEDPRNGEGNSGGVLRLTVQDIAACHGELKGRRAGRELLLLCLDSRQHDTLHRVNASCLSSELDRHLTAS